jgi:signal transduction histidine kinase
VHQLTTVTKQFHISMFEEVENRLKYKAEFINGIMDTSMDGIFVCEAIRDDNGDIVDLLMKRINPAFTQIRKIDERDVLGKRYLSLFPTAIETGIFDLYCKVIETGVSAQKEFNYKGQELDAWFRISAVKLGKNCLLVTFHDFTDLKNLQLQMEQKVKELERSNRNLEYFAFASSHDLKEPLRKVLLFADQLKGMHADVLDGEGVKCLGRLEAGIERMRKLVDGMLIYSELTQSQYNNQSVDLNAVISDVVNDLELHFIEKKASIQVEQLPVINGNYRQFHQLFQNLIENSLKFSLKEKPVEIRVLVKQISGKDSPIPLPSKKQSNRIFQIQVIDNGIGFDQEYAIRIFNVFQRLNSEYSGAGIGLFVARKVVENHTGWISASSVKDKGATVTIIIPC